MGLRQELEPRDRASAARAGAAFALAGAAVLGVATAASPAFTGGSTLGLVTTLAMAAVLVVLGVVALRAPDRLPRLFWAGVPTVVVVVTLVLDLVTRDASAGGQVFLCWPVLYAAYELRPRLAYAVLLEVVLADALVVLLLLPLERALSDLAAVAATLTVVCLLLVRARDREERLNAELRRQAAVDPLTGLATRRVLDEAARCALDAGASAQETALVLVDVDEFKAVNDAWGHPGGDAVLVHVAAVLRGCCREGATVARLGGDELAVLLPGCGLAVASEVAERFVRAVRAAPAPLPEGGHAPVTVSVGVAVRPRDATDLRGLYAAADAALYEAKRAGRDRVRLAGGPASPAAAPPEPAPVG
ncbi:GGDEF domain-containing protein [Vallicoccus soli]|uniref:GGDEF domain-containing protein n=1 Tax=Vallicoccus soli TaxID=2339232 RepID=A0A3A3ZM37_9ACTN|nr:GGDEF domain-containing protein [Vallicoccus soli]RJK97655.1 GGDEF domain-containing protein [Vallicoccus soli]